MLKAVAAIYLPTPAQVPPRVLPPVLDEDSPVQFAPPPGQSIILPGETFDPAAWGVSPGEAAIWVATGAADALPTDFGTLASA